MTTETIYEYEIKINPEKRLFSIMPKEKNLLPDQQKTRQDALDEFLYFHAQNKLIEFVIDGRITTVELFQRMTEEIRKKQDEILTQARVLQQKAERLRQDGIINPQPEQSEPDPEEESFQAP